MGPGVSLDALPFDVILKIFCYLSAYDVVKVCQTCKYLRAILEEYHVWLELAERCCSKNASVALYMVPLTARSTDELRTLVVEQARLDRYWATETVLSNPLPRFSSQASTPLLFCELLPGGKYLVLVHRNGDISLQSLVDLDDIHELSNLSLGPSSGHVHTVLLVADHKGCPLLVLSMYGSQRRLFFVTLEIEKRSINLVRSFALEIPVLAVAIQHDTVVCLCQCMGRNAFALVVTTLDDTARKVLSILRMLVDPATLYLCSICLPTPTTLLLFEASNIRCYHLPDLSELPPGDHSLPELSPIWSWESPTLPKARLTANYVRWEPGRTATTVVTLLCDFLSHTVTLCPSGKSSGSSHLDVTDHTYINTSRPISVPYQGTTLLQSQKGIWFRLENTAPCSHDFVTFSTDDVRRTGLVRLDISGVGMRGHLVPAINFDEVSGRIVVLARGLRGNLYVDYGFVVDVP